MDKLLKQLRKLRERAEELRAIPSEDFTEELIDELETNNEARKKLTRSISALHAATDLDEDEDRTSNGEIPGQWSGTPAKSENRGGGPVADKSYRGMFFSGDDQYQISRDGFENQSEFLECLRSGRFDDRLQRAAMGESVESSGGYSVPTSFAEKWLDDSLESEIVRPRCAVWAMDSPVRKVPGWDDLDRSDGSTFGGFKMEWLAEKASGTRQLEKMRMIELKAKKGAIFCQISSELEADGYDFQGQLTNALTKSIGYGFDSAFLFGSGAGLPQGILSSGNPALITVPKESAQASATIVYENLVKMYSRVSPACLGNACWICNNQAIPQLMSLSLSIGTSGAFFPALREVDSRFFLFGKPVLFSEHMQALGTAGDIALVDFSQYSIGLRKELSIDKSNAPGWTEDLVDYRILTRIDGQGTWSAPITPEHGSTLSWAVSLDERA